MNLLRRFVSSEMFEDGDPLPTASVVVVDQQDKVIRDGQEHGAVVVLTFTHSAQSKAEKLKATSSPPGCEAGNNSCDEKDGMVVVRLTSRNVDDSSVRDQISSAHRVVVVVPSTASLRDACYESLRPLFAPNPLPAETAEQVCLRELDMVKQTLTQLDQSNSIIVSEERFLELASYTAFESVVSSTVASLREALENLHVSYRA
ncbi:unnamed protein product [Amoebophrya sp. A25]|nr:unnamed protein product [Amoebophrya sp. A25]|eukprot:GSA25T00009169001.1